ncbi:bifunctional metallophosphatase/5'-nucleotidase [Bifidobacterium sp. CP2]|uniref:bifunctional metallophosphatase/5'-nucleotidase n=1 Tax=Bifidobacterium TaxID=1678 RepID=UPI001BDDC52B|nr:MULTISPECIES: 5'-nucleotidase C-terminal domain-containing protein [Bifidobacterium]MBT1180437.1 bifunctional metallophosphatase/5'-nucleotidase [Bifidobacterium sp. CP2]MBW3080612.1 bifunctional metallophosphatase/5'-nucleotidase [Bifidobacterium saguinibicoloris]
MAVLTGMAILAVAAVTVPNAFASNGMNPLTGTDPGNTGVVTVADITDFHGHIERGEANAEGFELAESHNPGGMVAVSAGDLVGGSPYESAYEQDRPTLDMAKTWGLGISAMGNHELDRGVADFNDRIADPANGIDWLCANVSARNKSAHGKLSRVKDYVIRKIGGKRVAFIGAITDALGAVTTPRITADADLGETAVHAINRVADQLSDGDEANGEADAVVVLLHADASAAAGHGDAAIDSNVDLVYSGHSHAVKRMRTAAGAPIIEAGSFGRQMAVQDLVIEGKGRHARVTVNDVDLGNGTTASAVPGVIDLNGDDGVARAKQAAWESAGTPAERVRRARDVYQAAAAGSQRVGNEVVGTIAKHAYFGKASRSGENALGTLVADAEREAVQRAAYAGDRIPVVGFSNDGSLRTRSLDLDGDGVITRREVDSMMALQFKVAKTTLTGRELKAVLAQQWRRHDGKLAVAHLGVSSNVSYRYSTDGEADVVSGEPARDAGDVRIVDLRVDGRPIGDDDIVIAAANSFLLQGGDRYTAFRTGSDYHEFDEGYGDALAAYLRRHPAVRNDAPATGTELA